MKFYANKLTLCSVATFGLALTAFFSACGDSNTTEVMEQTGMDVLAEGEKLPDCSKDNAGDMLYVADSAAAYYCVDGEWEILNGRDGEPGKEGTSTDGKAGTGCTTKAVDNGIEVSCDGKVIGTVKNGEPGVATDGKPGVGCKIDESEGNGIVKVTCGEGADEKTVTLYKAMCGTESYDPEKMVCFEYVLYGKADGYDADSKMLYDSRDNQLYKTVEICDKDNANCQTWMAENLNFNSNFKDAENKDVINSWCGGGSGTTAGDCSVYGRLYTWAAAIDSVALADDGYTCGYLKKCDRLTTDALAANPIQGVCPSGWHLPTNAEWSTLYTNVGGTSTAGKKLKASSSLWKTNSGVTNDDTYGFSVLPAGYRYNDGGFYDVGYYAYFWSSTEHGGYNAWGQYFDCNYDYVLQVGYGKYDGFSVRCLRSSL